MHCPHVSFEAEEDVYGFVKCNESEGRAPTDLFSQDTINSFLFAGSTYLNMTKPFKIQVGGGCPVD